MSARTYRELFCELHTLPLDGMIPWLQEKWKGPNKQEAVLNLFAALGFIEKLSDWEMMEGNYNLKNLNADFSLGEFMRSPIANSGNASDLTMTKRGSNSRHLLAFTSKDLNNLHVTGLDITNITARYEMYYREKGYDLSLGVAVRSREGLKGLMDRAHGTSNAELEWLRRPDTVIIDWGDLDASFRLFKEHPTLPDDPRPPLFLRLHQRLAVMKTIRMKAGGKHKCLWGHIPRSGKSYIGAGTIVADNGANYLWITTAPRETIDQIKDLFEGLNGYNVVHLNADTLNNPDGDKNIIIASMQFLKRRLDGEVIPWLKEMDFSMIFLDESHNGGTTDSSREVLDVYGNDVFKVYITGTYAKPTDTFQIPREDQVLWDNEDVVLCKDLDRNKDRLIVKHGQEFNEALTNYTSRAVQEEYQRFPELVQLTAKLTPEAVKSINEETHGTPYGWSLKSAFMLNPSGTFVTEEAALKPWWLVFGKKKPRGTPDPEYPPDTVFMERIKKISEAKGCRLANPLIIMAFLPEVGGISTLQNAMKDLLERNNVCQDYIICCVNSRETVDAKRDVESASQIAQNTGKRGVLVLSGSMLHLGVSLPMCDVVLLMNESRSWDRISQMQSRCMTERDGKGFGFVVHFDTIAMAESMVRNGRDMGLGGTSKEIISYLLEQRIVTVNPDDFEMGSTQNRLTMGDVVNAIHEIYTNKNVANINRTLARLDRSTFNLSRDEHEMLRAGFSYTRPTHEPNKSESDEDPEGPEDTEDRINPGNERVVDEIKENTELATKVVQDIIPHACLLTCKGEQRDIVDLGSMLDIIMDSEELKAIFMDHMKIRWKVENDEVIKSFNDIYKKRMSEDEDLKNVTETIKKMFVNSLGNREEFSKLVDKYLVVGEIEKKNHAEVSTPHSLRQDMLDAIPQEFWTSPKKVLEPCSGKGGFLIDIVDRFMEGLKVKIPDEEERYRVIVEECLTFVDINSKNIFINKLLLDPEDKYTLDARLGNTLETSLMHFDAVIGNPPYNDASGNRGRGHTLWDKFVMYALDHWLKDGSLLLYVHPSGWRKSDSRLNTVMRNKQIKQLEIHNVQDGNRVFKCSTRYDWYLLENKPRYTTTLIKGEDGETFEVDLGELEFIPNMAFNEIKNLMAAENQSTMDVHRYRGVYATDNRHGVVSRTRTDTHRYPLVNSIGRNGPDFRYSNRNDLGHFGRSKFIFSNGAGTLMDPNGEYGLTEWAYCIYDEAQTLENIERAFKDPRFKKVIKAIHVDGQNYNISVMKLFRKDFWREFV